MAVLILKLLKSSLKTELKCFFEDLQKSDEVVNQVSSAALCKARQKIRHELFEVQLQLIQSLFYRCIVGGRWQGFRLLGVDGSEISLPPSVELRNKFGHHHTNSIGTKIPQARVSFLTDVLNKVTIDAGIEPFKTSEQAMLLDHLSHIGGNDLLTADANYGHFWVLKKVVEARAQYCFQIGCSSNFVQGFLASGERDMVLEWIPSANTVNTCKRHKVDANPITVRLVRIYQKDKDKILITSLTDRNRFSYCDINELYNKRWNTEEEFKKFMQRLAIENFSSIKANGVLQDFYANVFMMNMVSFLSYHTNKQVYRESKGLKYRSQINWTAALGDVRRKFHLLFFRGLRKVESIVRSLWDSFKADAVPIKPGRNFKRDKRKKGSRNKVNIWYKPAW